MLAAILDSKNIFRFVELMLIKKVVFAKYYLTCLLDCGCSSQFGVNPLMPGGNKRVTYT